MSKPKVGIIMGSDSDLPVMSQAAEILDEMKVPYELTIVSAHRTPDRMVEYAKGAWDRGLRVIIAGAGGAAHLPGMVASYTTCPVIGVPVQSKTLSGVDSLHSIVQMPPGIPVATMAINGAKNAGLMAAKILATSDDTIAAEDKKFREGLTTMIEEKAEKLEQMGYQDYLKKHGK